MLYNIKKGKHRPKGWFKRMFYFINPLRLHFKRINKVEGTFIFHKSCIYDTSERPGRNKLFGFTYGSHGEKTVGKVFPKLCNSLCLDFKPTFFDDRISVYIKTDYNGIEDLHGAISVPVKWKHKFNITRKGFNKYVILIGETLVAEVKVNTKFKLGYFLSPYIGGHYPAAHNMSLDLTIDKIEYENS